MWTAHCYNLIKMLRLLFVVATSMFSLYGTNSFSNANTIRTCSDEIEEPIEEEDMEKEIIDL